MIKIFSLLSTLVLIAGSLSAQKKTQSFEFPLAANKVQHSLYNSITVLDSRTDTTNIGVVQVGGFNRKARVVAKTPLSAQFNNVFKSLIDETAQQNELLLQIRQFAFAEVTGAVTEKGYCYIRVELYVKKADQYQKLSRLDTVLSLRSAIDVTDAILKKGAETMTGFITGNLLTTPTTGVTYSYNDLLNIDQVEKRSLKLYNSTAFTDGLYYNYQSFKDQKPDAQFVLEGNDLDSGNILVTDANGKKQKIKSKNLYAVVFRGEAFIATPDAYYPLKKVNDDLLFTGKATVAASSAEMITATMFFGIIGGLMAQNSESTFEMKLDHVNGGFIRLKEIPDKVYDDR